MGIEEIFVESQISVFFILFIRIKRKCTQTFNVFSFYKIAIPSFREIIFYSLNKVALFINYMKLLPKYAASGNDCNNKNDLHR